MRYTTIKIVSAMLLIATSVQAQEAPKVDTAYSPALSKALPIEPAKLRVPQIAAAPIALPPTIPPKEETPRSDLPRPMVQQIGYVLPVDHPMLASVPWAQLPDGGAVLRVELRSPDALGLRVQLSDASGWNGMELRVYEPGGLTVLGPYSSPHLLREKSWWTPTIFGDTIGLEFYLPPGAPLPDPLPEILAVAYINCRCAFAPGATGGCHNDVTCSADWATDASAVTRITFISGGGCSACTGALLNRPGDDFSPLLMTANHCVDTQAEASTVEAFWFYQSPCCPGTPGCTGTAPAPNTVPRTMGTLLLRQFIGTDWVLLGLFDRPPAGAAFLGWDANAWNSGDAATGIHHPRGSFKRISRGDASGSTDNAGFDSNGDGMTDFRADVWNVDWTSGITEPGSSGSPIFDSARRVRGTLTGGSSACPTMMNPSPPTRDRYGRFDRAFPTLRPFLFDIASPVYVDGTFAGEERGTQTNPFNTVGEAAFAVRTGDQILIRAGTYGGGFTISRAMTLRAQGGVVRIGN